MVKCRSTWDTWECAIRQYVILKRMRKEPFGKDGSEKIWNALLMMCSYNFWEQMNKSVAELLGKYGFKNSAIDGAIEKETLLGLVHESTGAEMAMYISAMDLEFPSGESILSHPNMFVGSTSASVTTNKNNIGAKNVQRASTTKMV